MSRVALGVAAVVAALGVAFFALWPTGSRPRIDATVAVREALADDRAGFTRALAPRPLSFPSDHGPHPDFGTEWWYYTGNLRTAAGRHVGFQLTFFRIALAPGAVVRASAWATRQLYVAHFAVSDVAGGRFHAFSRGSREALGLAGASASPFRVWIEDWSAEGDGSSARLRASDGAVALDLELSAAKPVVAQGDRGLSRKGPEPGNASFYYSFTRMPARGIVRLGRETLEVSGEAWMDREWSTSALGSGVEGWDWFALQLDDGCEPAWVTIAALQEDAMPDTLYKRLGGYDAIAAVADNLLPRLTADPQLGRFWQHRGEDGVRREKQLLIDFLCASAGGPLYYVGREMKLSHRGLGINERDWQVFLGHVNATLDHFKVPSQEKSEVLGFVESLKKDIVE